MLVSCFCLYLRFLLEAHPVAYNLWSFLAQQSSIVQRFAANLIFTELYLCAVFQYHLMECLCCKRSVDLL